MNQSAQPSTLSSFLRGALSSAGSGLLMSTIFYGLTFLAQTVAPAALHVPPAPAFGAFLLGAIGPIALMVTAVAIFGGVMAVKRAGHHHHAQAMGHHHAHGQSIEPVPVMVPALGVAADRAEAPTRSDWTERTGGADRSNRIAQILDNGSMSDKSRAAALLAEREQAANSQQQVG